MIAVKIFVVFLLIAISFGCAKAQVVKQPKPDETKNAPGEKAIDLSRFFENTTGAIVIYDQKNNRYFRYNEKRCAERFTPASTFKIPNALIGLETGAVKDAETVIARDKKKYPEDNWTSEPFVHWKQDHTLRTAIKYSVVWYFRELARRVGEQRMKSYVEKFEYGNRDISGGLTSERMFEAFWLSNSLKISADEQIEFLRKFYDGKLPVSKRSTEIVKQILVQEETPEYKFSAKTGGGRNDEKALGWFVGYVETKDNRYFFALNIDGENYAAIKDKRIDLTRRILNELGFMKNKF
jgi:beta-lactamase class D